MGQKGVNITSLDSVNLIQLDDITKEKIEVEKEHAVIVVVDLGDMAVFVIKVVGTKIEIGIVGIEIEAGTPIRIVMGEEMGAAPAEVLGLEVVICDLLVTTEAVVEV